MIVRRRSDGCHVAEHPSSTSCHAAREAISSRVDGERLGVPAASLDAHLAGCRACRRFEADIVRLKQQLALGASRPVPPELRAGLARQLRDARPVGFAAALRRARAALRRAGRPAARWSTAVVPAILLAVALPLAASPPRGSPPPVPTLCSPRVLHW